MSIKLGLGLNVNEMSKRKFLKALKEAAKDTEIIPEADREFIFCDHQTIMGIVPKTELLKQALIDADLRPLDFTNTKIRNENYSPDRIDLCVVRLPIDELRCAMTIMLALTPTYIHEKDYWRIYCKKDMPVIFHSEIADVVIAPVVESGGVLSTEYKIGEIIPKFDEALSALKAINYTDKEILELKSRIFAEITAKQI